MIFSLDRTSCYKEYTRQFFGSNTVSRRNSKLYHNVLLNLSFIKRLKEGHKTLLFHSGDYHRILVWGFIELNSHSFKRRKLEYCLYETAYFTLPLCLYIYYFTVQADVIRPVCFSLQRTILLSIILSFYLIFLNILERVRHYRNICSTEKKYFFS